MSQRLEIRSGVRTLAAVMDEICSAEAGSIVPTTVLVDLLRELRARYDHLLDYLRIFIESGPLPGNEQERLTRQDARYLQSMLQHQHIALCGDGKISVGEMTQFRIRLLATDIMRRAERTAATQNRIAQYFR